MIRTTKAARFVAAATCLAAGVATLSPTGATAESAWPSENGNSQHTRSGADTDFGPTGPMSPRVKWTWHDPSYVADGSIGGTRSRVPGVLDGSGRLLFKSRDTRFDDLPGQPPRYDLLALDPATGDAEVLLPDVQDGYCVPVVGPDDTIWTFQAINERTEHIPHHPEASSWLVGIDPATDTVVHRYSGEGVHPADHSALGNCIGSMNVAPDGTVVFVGTRPDSSPGGFDQWLRAINPDGTSRWEVNLDARHAATLNWVEGSATGWQLRSASPAPGEPLYLGYEWVDPATGARRPALASFDMATGALLGTQHLPGARFASNPVIVSGSVLAVTEAVSGPRGSGHVVRLTRDLVVGDRVDVVAGQARHGELPAIPRSLQVQGNFVVGWSAAADDLLSFRWVGLHFEWRTPVGFRNTDQVVLDGRGHAYVARLSREEGVQLQSFNRAGRLIGALEGPQIHGIRTVGPLAADGTLYVWGDDNTWAALEQDPDGPVPCPLGTSDTVTCWGDSATGFLMRGTGADEYFKGSISRDTMVGGGGEDSMLGSNGRDRLAGGGGPDTLRGMGGPDKLRGNGGSDTLQGHAGRDRYSSGGGRDLVKSDGQRRERVRCGGGRDRVAGAAGDRVADDCETVRRR